jgi:hypothetical protein
MAAGWEMGAACRNLDPALFYPAKGDVEQSERARAVCARCPVREACLASTLADEKRLRPADREGIRGGLDGRERYVAQHGEPKPRRRRKRATRPPKPRRLKPCGTPAAYSRHVRRGEPIDAACRKAKSALYSNPRAELPADRPVCGTRTGYRWHVEHHEIPCEPCTQADLAVTWFIRERVA